MGTATAERPIQGSFEETPAHKIDIHVDHVIGEPFALKTALAKVASPIVVDQKTVIEEQTLQAEQTQSAFYIRSGRGRANNPNWEDAREYVPMRVVFQRSSSASTASAPI